MNTRGNTSHNIKTTKTRKILSNFTEQSTDKYENEKQLNSSNTTKLKVLNILGKFFPKHKICECFG